MLLKKAGKGDILMIPLFKPYMPEVSHIEDILKSGQIAYGKYTVEFEEKLKEYFNTPYLMVTASFHFAILTALRALGIEPGGEIITSPMACLASTQPLITYGVNVVWADVDPLRGTLSPNSVEKSITKNTKVIMHNHFCGYPGYIDEINAIGAKHGIPVIDDGIECFGSVYRGNKVGSCGTDVTVFSLTAVRFCNCIDGGVIIFKDREQYEKALLIRDCGIDRTKFRDNIGEINESCDISLKGYSATMSNVNGYIGLRQMEDIEDLLKKHAFQADKWKEFFSEQSSFKPIYCEECIPNYWVYGVLAENKRKAIETFRKMGYNASGVHIRNDLYSVFGGVKKELHGVDNFYNAFVALPCGWWM